MLTALGLDAPVVAAELELDTLLDAARRDRTFRTPSRFPASSVDLAFVLADTVATADVLATLRTAVGGALEDVRVFDVFTSDAFGPGRRSLAFALRFRLPDRTLTDADVGDPPPAGDRCGDRRPRGRTAGLGHRRHSDWRARSQRLVAVAVVAAVARGR